MSVLIEQAFSVGARPRVEPPSSAPGAAATSLDDAELRERFVRLTHLLYDTRVPLDVLDSEVVPHLAAGVEFVDPWVHIRGRDVFRAGLRGFHCVIHFDFDIRQLAVQRSPAGDAARVIVDGVMYLRQLRIYTYPLRTTLVYDVRLDGVGGYEVARLDEMWSAGDLLANLPVVGRVYDAGRRAWGRFFERTFRLSCALATRLRPSLLGLSGEPG